MGVQRMRSVVVANSTPFFVPKANSTRKILGCKRLAENSGGILPQETVNGFLIASVDWALPLRLHIALFRIPNKVIFVLK